MTRRVRVIAAVAAGSVAVFVALSLGLRHVAFFRVRQVELIGVRYHSPKDVLARAALRTDQNLFDDFDDVRERLLRVPGIVDARFERRTPATLRLRVTERVPVALVANPEGLIPLDASAKPLPYDPSRSGLDLPIVARADSVLTETLAALSAVDPQLYRAVDGVRQLGSGGVALLVGEGTVLFRGVPSLQAIESVSAVRRHLVAGGQTFTELDARFSGLVVVREKGA